MANVVIDGKEYPIKCNIKVMQAIQDKYKTLFNFELKVAGYEPAKNDDGTLMMRDGSPVMKLTEPSLEAIYSILPLMLEAAGNEKVELSEDILEFDIADIGSAMHEAYKECYERKNQQPVKGQTEKVTRKK